MDDLISRQAAIEEMREMYHAAEKWGQEAEDDTMKARAESCMATLVEMHLRVEKLPSAEPQRKKGEWKGEVRMYSNGHPRYIYHCSECGFKEEHAYIDSSCSNYCPNCGADMRGEQDG